MYLNPYVAGGIGRFGSKFECLIFPAAAIIVGALFLLAARNRGKKDDIAEEKAFVLSSLPAMAIFFFMELFCMLGGLRNK